MYLGSFVVVGLALSILGPSIGALKAQVGVDTGQISAVFTAQGAGYLLGASVIGRHFDRGASNRLFGRGLLALAVGVAAVPAARSLVVLVGLFGLIGAAAGTIDVGANTLLTRRRSAASASWLATLHLSFGVGALASPALVALSESLNDDVLIAAMGTAVVSCIVAAWAARADAPAAEGLAFDGPTGDATDDLVEGPPPIPPAPHRRERSAMPRAAWLIVGGLLLNVAAELLVRRMDPHLLRGRGPRSGHGHRRHGGLLGGVRHRTASERLPGPADVQLGHVVALRDAGAGRRRGDGDRPGITSDRVDGCGAHRVRARSPVPHDHRVGW